MKKLWISWMFSLKSDLLQPWIKSMLHVFIAYNCTPPSQWGVPATAIVISLYRKLDNSLAYYLSCKTTLTELRNNLPKTAEYASINDSWFLHQITCLGFEDFRVLSFQGGWVADYIIYSLAILGGKPLHGYKAITPNCVTCFNCVRSL